MTGAQTIVGKWRFTTMSTWDQDYIDLVEPGFIAFAVRTTGEMAFGVVTATLDCAFDKTKCDVSFDFTGCDEGDEVLGPRMGRDDGLRHHHRRDRAPKRRRHYVRSLSLVIESSSAAC